MYSLPVSAVFCLLLSIHCLAQSTNPVASNGTGPIVNLGYVSYLGIQNQTAGITYYRGIPYAQPPLGALRWQKPRSIESNNGFDGQTFNATQITPACYQSVPFSLYTPGGTNASSFEATPQGQSEDCLILDVLVPTSPVSAFLPVVVQIHGGGYTEGNAQSYAGDALVNASNGNIIYVSIQYRLGLFGFLASSAVSENGALNAGMLDQREALDWVQRNIRAFGGDPAKVTIWGGSAGGGSVTYQVIANGGADEPPFRAAIAEYPWWQPLLNSSSQERQYRTTLQLAGCTDLTCLRSLPSPSLAKLDQAVQNASNDATGFGDFYWGPVVDGVFIRELPSESFKKGNFYKVPLIVDHDQFEGEIFSNTTQTGQVAETMDAENLFPFAGPSFFSRLYQLFPRSSYNSTYHQRADWYGKFIIDCPTYQMASASVDMLSNSSAVFKLIFAQGSQLHGATASFLASNITGFPGANNLTTAEILSSYWISFAVTLDPNPMRVAEAPFWPSYISGGNGSISNGEGVGFSVLDVTYGGIAVEEDPDVSEACEFFGDRAWTVRN